MNERIQELAEQAEEYALSVCDNNGHFHRIYREKFAELIVKECAQSLWTEECNVSDLALEEFKKNSKKIKQHFGVEE